MHVCQYGKNTLPQKRINTWKEKYLKPVAKKNSAVTKLKVLPNTPRNYFL